MKKILSIICVLALSLILVACNTQTPSQGTSSQKGTENKKLSLIATSFYQYDWLMQVLGDTAEDFDVTLLVDDGTDLHNYEPTAKDMLKITSSDMFIYNGGESDNWVADVISTGGNEDLNAISIMALLEDDILSHAGTSNVDGEEEHDHDHDDDCCEEEHHHHENDEHVWLSLENAETATRALANEMSKLDQANKDTYQANAKAYIEKLSKLDDEYEELTSGDVRDLIIFADRFPFAYLVSDYDLEYYAAFEGCSAESEASFETIAWLTDAANDHDVKYLLIIESGTKDIANTIIGGMNNKDCEVLVLNSIQSVTKDQINSGTTYLSIMTENLEVLKLALEK